MRIVAFSFLIFLAFGLSAASADGLFGGRRGLKMFAFANVFSAAERDDTEPDGESTALSTNSAEAGVGQGVSTSSLAAADSDPGGSALAFGSACGNIGLFSTCD